MSLVTNRKLVIVLIGENPASVLYVKKKLQRASEKRILTELVSLSSQSKKVEIVSLIQKLNQDASVGGVLVQLPLPKQLLNETREILDTISPDKDVDCLTSTNLVLLDSGKPRFYPAATRAVLEILGEQLNKKLVFAEGSGALNGKKAVVVGESNLVGKPVATVLRNLGATVSIFNDQSSKIELAKACPEADILVSATGVPHLIKKDMVKPRAIVIDVGIARNESGKLVGDVDYEQVVKVASFVSPVPGGVGPRTVEALLDNFSSIND